MMLSRSSEYALQATLYIAGQGELAPITGPSIARSINVPSKYLSVVLGALVKADVLYASPGRSGGFRLAGPPETIRLVSLFTPFEAMLSNKRPCPFGQEVCSDETPCIGHDRWKIVRGSFLDFVNNTTIADLMTRTDSKPNAVRPRRRATGKKAKSRR